MREPGLSAVLELVRVEQDDGAAFRFGVQEYLLRSDDGTYAAATLRWDDALLESLARVRDGRDPAAVQALGERLRRLLATTRFAAIEEAIERAAQERRPVRVEIAAAAAELYALPWELLTIGRAARHLGELPGVELVYRWPGARAAPTARPAHREGGRVLVAWSRAFGNVGERFAIDAIAAALQAGGLGFDASRDVIGDASLAGLAAALAARVEAGDPPDLLYLLCHGAPVGSGYGLGLDDGRGGRVVIDGGALRRALAPFAGHVRAVMLMACDGGNPGAIGAHLGSAAHELHRGGFAAVIAPRWPVAGASAHALTGHVLKGMLEGACSIEQALQAGRERLLAAGSPDWAAYQLYSHADADAGTRPFVVRPYRGLLAFEREHAGLFFGRDAELAEVLGDLDALIEGGRPRLLVVAGASGTGKSSLVLAAARAALERQGRQVAVIRPGRVPAEALDAVLRTRRAGEPFVLIVDQFEEVFTHAIDQGDAAGAAAFVRSLWGLVTRPDERVAVIATLRVDFAGRCGELVLDDRGTRLDALVYDEAHRVFVAELSPAALREVIERPAQRVGLRVEAGLAERLIQELRGESNALPLLEYVLDELWRRREGDVLTHAALDASGGVHGALARHADALVDGLDDAAREQARRTFVRLVQFGGDPATGARRREDIAGLRSRRDPEAWDRALAALVAARLLVRRGDDPARATLEVAHEALIRRWGRLWTWYQADLRRLTMADELARLVAQWRAYGPLTGKALAFAQELVHGLEADDVPADAREMLAVSEARATRQARLRRGLVGAAIGTLAVFLTVVSALYVRAVANFRDAEANRARADGAAARMDVTSRLVMAELLRADRPHLAAALLRDLPGEQLPRWRDLAWNTLQTPLPAIWDGPATPAEHVAFTADGSFVAGLADGTLRGYWAGRGEARVFPGAGPVQALAFAPSDAHLYVVRPTTIEVWARRDDTLERRSEVELRAGPERDLAVGAQSGRVVLVAGETHLVFEPAGDRLEPRGAREGCLTLDAGSEQRICRAGADAALVETWTGAPVGRVESPGLAAARATHGGLVARAGPLVAWSWPGAGATLTRHAVDGAQLADIDEVMVFPGGVGWRRTVGAGDEPRRQWCAAIGGRTTCVDAPLDATFAGVVGREVVMSSPEGIDLRARETRALSRRLRGPDSTDRRRFVDARGFVALFDTKGRAWRWDLRRPRSGALAFGGAGPGAATDDRRSPVLQAERGRVVAVATTTDAVVVAAWPLRSETIAERSPALRRELPLAPGESYVGRLIDHDAFVVRIAAADGSERLLVGDLRDAAIDLRPAALPIAADTAVVALAPGGAHMFTVRNGALARRSLRDPTATGETLPVTVMPGSPVLLDPRGRRLAVVDGAAKTLSLLDLTDPLAPPVVRAAVLGAAFAPDGQMLALGLEGGAVAFVDIGPDGRLVDRALLRRHRSPPRLLAFSADGTQLVSADPSRQLMLWSDLGAALPRGLATISDERITALGFSPDGAQVWALARTGELRFWSVLGDDPALAAELRVRSTYCVPAGEWSDLGLSQVDAAALAARTCAAARDGGAGG